MVSAGQLRNELGVLDATTWKGDPQRTVPIRCKVKRLLLLVALHVLLFEEALEINRVFLSLIFHLPFVQKSRQFGC